MRKIACTVRAHGGVRRVMIYPADGGTCLFLYRSLEDGPGNAYEGYETTPEAEVVCRQRYGISDAAWQSAG